MNDIFYQKWLKSKFKDLRKKEALQWFKDTYFVALYDANDNYITQFEDIEMAGHYFNIPIYKVLHIVRTDSLIEVNHHRCKMYLVKKEPIMEEVRRR